MSLLNKFISATIISILSISCGNTPTVKNPKKEIEKKIEDSKSYLKNELKNYMIAEVGLTERQADELLSDSASSTSLFISETEDSDLTNKISALMSSILTKIEDLNLTEEQISKVAYGTSKVISQKIKEAAKLDNIELDLNNIEITVLKVQEKALDGINKDKFIKVSEQLASGTLDGIADHKDLKNNEVKNELARKIVIKNIEIISKKDDTTEVVNILIKKVTVGIINNKNNIDKENSSELIGSIMNGVSEGISKNEKMDSHKISEILKENASNIIQEANKNRKLEEADLSKLTEKINEGVTRGLLNSNNPNKDNVLSTINSTFEGILEGSRKIGKDDKSILDRLSESKDNSTKDFIEKNKDKIPEEVRTSLDNDVRTKEDARNAVLHSLNRLNESLKLINENIIGTELQGIKDCLGNKGTDYNSIKGAFYDASLVKEELGKPIDFSTHKSLIEKAYKTNIYLGEILNNFSSCDRFIKIDPYCVNTTNEIKLKYKSSNLTDSFNLTSNTGIGTFTISKPKDILGHHLSEGDVSMDYLNILNSPNLIEAKGFNNSIQDGIYKFRSESKGICLYTESGHCLTENICLVIDTKPDFRLIYSPMPPKSNTDFTDSYTLNFNWNIPYSRNPISSYNLQVARPSTDDNEPPVIMTINTKETNLNVILNNEGYYIARVQSIDVVGNMSLFSKFSSRILIDKTPPKSAQIKSVLTSISNNMTSALVSWEEGTDNFTNVSDLKYIICTSLKLEDIHLSNKCNQSEPGSKSLNINITTDDSVNTFYTIISTIDQTGNKSQSQIFQANIITNNNYFDN